MKRVLVSALVGVAFAGWAESEYNRTFFCRENRQPDLGCWEAGVLSQYQQFDEATDVKYAKWKRKETTVCPYLRYGLFENLTAFANLPVGYVKSERLDEKNFGLRDVSLGLELLAFEYTFGYPYVLPYTELTLPTGDEEKALGRDKTNVGFGTAVGTTVYDVYHYILDGRYDVNYGEDGTFSLAAAFIWDLSERFSMMAEAKGTNEDFPGKSGVPVYIRGGMFYKVSDQLMLSWYGGGAVNAEEEGMGAFKVGYLF